jgi:DNA-binding transcriptional MerR regulator
MDATSSKGSALNPLRYPIRAVSKLTNISVDTLRAWERRYGVVEPERDERGRLYSEEDVERLRLLKQAVEHGHAIGRIARFTTEELRTLLARGAPILTEAQIPAGALDLAPLQAAVDRLDGPALRRELSRLAALIPARTIALEIAMPLLRQVGEAWHEGRATIAQEHLVSAEVRSLIGALSRLHATPDSAPRILLATPAGEQHELGTLVAALLAAGNGYASLYLGPNLPANEIVGSARRLVPKAVVLGYTGAETSPGAREQLQVVSRDLPSGVELWIGGAGVGELRGMLNGRRVMLLEGLDAYEAALAELRTR